MSPDVEAKVAAVITSDLIAINAGSNRSISVGDRVQLYRVVQVDDPDTNEPLGRVLLVKLKLKVNHVQEKLCTASVDDGASSGYSSLRLKRKRIARKEIEATDDAIYVAVGERATVHMRGKDEKSQKVSDEPPF